jgi:predicted nuclease of predicted toxin-antitoxin system
MLFLANENFPLKSVRLLRQDGHDVIAIIEDMPGAKDLAVLDRAHEENRILLTFDRDYGDLIFRRKLPAPQGVIYLRFVPSSPEEPAEWMRRLLSLPGSDLIGRFTVLERRRVRQRMLR